MPSYMDYNKIFESLRDQNLIVYSVGTRDSNLFNISLTPSLFFIYSLLVYGLVSFYAQPPQSSIYSINSALVYAVALVHWQYFYENHLILISQRQTMMIRKLKRTLPIIAGWMELHLPFLMSSVREFSLYLSWLTIL